MAFTSLGKILPNRLRQAGIDHAVQASQVLFIADKLLDEWFGIGTTETNAKAISVKHRKLSIASMDAGLRQKLRMREKEYVSEVNKKAGQTVVEGIRILV